MARSLTAFLVTDDRCDRDTSLAVAGRALQGGVSAVVVRLPRATAREVFEMARLLRPATRRSGCALLVSDRIDVALAADADGAHLGARSLPIAAARRVLPRGKLLGCSVHNLDEAGEAAEGGADYLFLGPVFPTATHPGQAAIGLDPYREALLRSPVPVVAIGGITPDRAREVAAAGGSGVAAISCFYDAPDAAEVARQLRAAFVR